MALKVKRVRLPLSRVQKLLLTVVTDVIDSCSCIIAKVLFQLANDLPSTTGQVEPEVFLLIWIVPPACRWPCGLRPDAELAWPRLERHRRPQ